jgi:undecaprenyl-diphosphatase
MTLFQTITLAIVEGFTEFLPISSTGHLVLVSYFLNIKESAALETFEIVSQCGAIAAVVVIYIRKLLERELLLKLAIAFVPTGVIGLLVYPHIKAWLQNPLLVAYTMTLGGFAILAVEYWYKKLPASTIATSSSLSYKEACLLGFYQALAVIPGVSRSGAMIIGGLTMKLRRDVLTEFTFLLAVPTMCIATIYTLYKKHTDLATEDMTMIGIGTAISFVIAYTVIRYFLSYIRSHSFSIFGWYRIIVGVLLLGVMLY